MCKKVWKTAARTALCLCLSLWMAMAPCAEGYAYGGKNIYQDLATEMPGAAEASTEAAPGEETPEKSGTDTNPGQELLMAVQPAEASAAEDTAAETAAPEGSTVQEEPVQDGSAAGTEAGTGTEQEAAVIEEPQDPQPGETTPSTAETDEASAITDSAGTSGETGDGSISEVSDSPETAGTPETKQETTADVETSTSDATTETEKSKEAETTEKPEESKATDGSNETESSQESEESEELEEEEILLGRKLKAAPALKAAGSVHTEKAVNSSAVEVVKLGSTADSAYAFSLRPNSATTIEPFGFKSGEVYRESDKRFTAYVSSDSQSGNCGFWIYNAGRYHGKVVDVKGTITYKSGETPTIFFGTSGASFGCWFQNYPYFIRYDLYTKENGKEVPLKVTMSATLLDIDYYQKFAVKANSGSIAKIQVTNTSEVWYGTNSAYPDWKYLFAGSDTDYPTTPIEEAVKAEARVLFRDTGSFSVAYSSQQYESLFPGMGMDDNIVAWKWTDDAKEAVRNGEWYDGPKHYMAFSAIAFGPYDVPTPVKTVTDADETEVTANTISDTETFNFDISQEVPYERDEAYYYSAFVMKDTVPTGLKVMSVKILNEAGGNATGKFNVKTSGQTVTATALDTSAGSFYNQEYTMQIFCKYDPSAGNSGPWKNQASVEVTRNGKTETKKSNETTTEIPFRKVTTEVVNGTITPSDTKVKVGTDKKIDYSPKEGHFLTSISVDEKEIDQAGYPSTYSFTNIQADHKIKVVYSPNPTKQVVDSKGSDINGKLIGQGSTITYKINVTNASDFAKTVTVTDQIPAGVTFVSADNGGTAKDSTVTWANASVPAKSTKTVSFTAKATGEGSIRNAAKVQIAGQELPTNEVTNEIIPPPKKSVTDQSGKDVDKMDVEFEEELTYHVTVKNSADTEKTFTLTDAVPAHAELVSAGDGGEVKDGSITWTLQLAAGAEKTVSFVVKTKDKNCRIENTAKQTVDDLSMDSNTVVNYVQPDPIKTASLSDVKGKENATVEAPANPTAAAGQDCNEKIFFRTEDNTVIYTITWKNITDTPTEFTLRDEIPKGMEILSVSDGGATERNTVIWTGTAESGEEVVRTVTVRMPDGAKASVFRNRAGLSSSRTRRETNDVVTYLTDPPSKKVVDSSGADVDGQVIDYGTPYEYRVTIHNPREEKTVFTVTDRVPDELTILGVIGHAHLGGQTVTWTEELAPDEARTLVIRFEAKKSAQDARVDNTAYVSTPQYERDTQTVTNYVMVDPVKKVLSKEKEDVHGFLRKAGDILTYVIVVKNPADTEQEVTVTDPLPRGTDFISADHDGTGKKNTVTWNLVLSSEETVELTATVRIKEGTEGEILKNKAQVRFRSTGKDTNEVENPVMPDPVKKVLDKSGNDIDGHPIDLGQIITYSITQENPANDEKTFVITDEVPQHMKWDRILDGGKESGGTITWEVTIPAHGRKTVSFTASALKKAFQYENQAVVTADGVRKTTNTVINAVPEDPVKSVALKDGTDADGKTVFAGSELVYGVTVNNPFGYEKEFIVTDRIPEHTEYVGSDNGGKLQDGAVVWKLKMKKNETRTIHVTVKVKDDTENVKLVNRATQSADSWKKETNEVVAYVPFHPKKEVLNERGESCNESIVKPGDVLTYRITVYNPKEAGTAHYVIRDFYPSDKVQFLYASDRGKESDDGGRRKVRWEVDVAPGKEREVSFRVCVRDQKEPIANCAEAELGGHTVQTGTVVNYLLTASDAEKFVYYSGKEWNKQEVETGLLLEYRIRVHNPSANERTLRVTDVLDTHLEYKDSSHGGRYENGSVVWDVKLAGNTDLFVTVTAKVKENTPGGTVIRNRAKVSIDGKEITTNEVENPVKKTDPPAAARVINAMKTGDNGKVLFSGILMALSGMGIALWVLRRKVRG